MDQKQTLLSRIESREARVGVLGLGYVGLPVAASVAEAGFPTLGFEVETNLRLGFGYLRMLLDRYGDTRLALLAYNRGPGTVEGLLAAGEDPENGYAERVLSVRTRPAR